MAKAYDVPADRLIARLASDLRGRGRERAKVDTVRKEESGVHAPTRPPHERDWWHTRCASLLRKIYLNGPIGVGRLCAKYGGASRSSHRLWLGVPP